MKYQQNTAVKERETESRGRRLDSKILSEEFFLIYARSPPTGLPSLLLQPSWQNIFLHLLLSACSACSPAFFFFLFLFSRHSANSYAKASVTDARVHPHGEPS